jgi:endothelin-converting enzyme
MSFSKESFTDYYSHTNSHWIKSFTLPDDYSRYSTFQIISTKINSQIYQILTDLKSTNFSNLNPEQKLIVDLYTKISDYDSRDRLKTQPLDELYNLIDSTKSLGLVLGILSVFDLCPFVTIYVGQDLKESSKYIINIVESDCLLPSKEYYVEPSYQSIRTQYIKFIEKYLQMTQPGLTEKIRSGLAHKLFEFEKKLANALLSNVERRDVDNIYNIVSFKKIQSLIPSLDLKQMIKPLGDLSIKIFDHLDSVNSYNFKYFETLEQLLKSEHQDLFVQYIKLWIFVKMGKHLSTECESLCFDFFETVINGTEKQKSPDIKIVEAMSGIVGELIGKEYIKLYYDPSTTEYIDRMITQIKKASCELISGCGWMESKTKILGIKKIKSMGVHIAHTKIFKDFSPLYEQINSKNLIQTLLIYSIFYSKHQLSKLGTKPDPNEWHMNSYDVNAYYNPLMNQMVFPAGILQEPFFSLGASWEENLGGIGTVIAHEISHGFDDQGRKFNSKGQLSEWWTQKDITAYIKKTEPLVKQFDSIEILGHKVSGKLTLGENIADYTAVTICTRVLGQAKSHQFKLLYKSYANVWKQKIRQEELIKRLKTDPHAPGRYRTNQILSNIPEFIKAYELDSSHPMYIPESLRVNLWN